AHRNGQRDKAAQGDALLAGWGGWRRGHASFLLRIIFLYIEYLRITVLEMRKFDLEDLAIVRAVVTHGGVTRAAKALHRVPSNVTTRIKQLEARLDVHLFARRGRNLVPTEEGRLLTSYADRLLRLAHEAESALVERSEEHTSELQSRENLVCRLLLEQKNT